MSYNGGNQCGTGYSGNNCCPCSHDRSRSYGGIALTETQIAAEKRKKELDIHNDKDPYRLKPTDKASMSNGEVQAGSYVMIALAVLAVLILISVSGPY